MKKDVLIYLTGEGNYTWLHYLDGNKHLTAQTLKFLQTLLPNYIRIHKSILVNPACIRMIRAFPDSLSGAVVLHDGTELPVSRRRWASMRGQLMRTSFSMQPAYS
jgi:DNA-binding LytR/AlgR family response regulator